MSTEPVQAGPHRIGLMFSLVGGAALTHTFGFLHHRASGRYYLAWAESTREGPSRVLFSSSEKLAEGWSEPRTLGQVDGPAESLQLASGGGTQVPMLFLSYRPIVPPGSRRPMALLSSEDGGQTWSGPHLVRQDEPLPQGGQVPPLDPPGGPGTEHLLSTFVPAPSHEAGRPDAWGLVATDRFIEWSLGLRPWQQDGWGETLYLGVRHHMPLPAFLAEDSDGTLCVVTLRSPTDYRQDAERPPFPQVQAVRLDMDAIRKDGNGDGQPDLEDWLEVHYHGEDVYRLWLQCRVDSRELQRRPFISGVRKALKLSRGLVLQSPRPFVRPGQGVPRTLMLMGRGVSRQVSVQDIASNRGSRYYEERGKDRYPDTQGFQLAPGELSADDVKPGMVLVSPGWGQPTLRFTADLQVPSQTGELPEKALFGFWSHQFPGSILRTMPPDPESGENVSCRVVVELDEEVVLEDGLSFSVLVPEDHPVPDRSPQVVGYDEDPGPGYRLLGLGRVTAITASAGSGRHVTHGTIL